MSKLQTVRRIATTTDTESAGPSPSSGPVPVVTVLATAGDVADVLRELGQKIHALLGETPQVAAVAHRAIAGVIETGELRIDRGAHRVTVDGEEVFLTGLEFRLLVTLAERRDRVQTRSTLLREVWDSSGFVETRTVDTHVARIRDKLGRAGRFIHTIRGTGYRFSDVPTSRDGRRRAPHLSARIARLQVTPHALSAGSR